MSKRHLPVLPPDFVDPKLPRGTFSASQYNTYKKCPKAYEFSYVEGIKIPPSGILLSGTSVHHGVEQAHVHVIEKGTAPVLDDVKSSISDYFEAEKETVGEWEEGYDAGSTKDKVLRGYEVYHRQALPKVKPVAAEQAFVKRIGTVPMVGFIDLIDAPKPGEMVVADLKTGKASWSQADLDKDVQFSIYSIVTGIRDVRLDNLVFKKAGPDFSQKYSTQTDQGLRNVVEDVEETADLIKRGVFPKTSIDHWSCNPKWCGYWSQCRGRSVDGV